MEKEINDKILEGKRLIDENLFRLKNPRNQILYLYDLYYNDNINIEFLEDIGVNESTNDVVSLTVSNKLDNYLNICLVKIGTDLLIREYKKLRKKKRNKVIDDFNNYDYAFVAEVIIKNDLEGIFDTQDIVQMVESFQKSEGIQIKENKNDKKETGSVFKTVKNKIKRKKDNPKQNKSIDRKIKIKKISKKILVTAGIVVGSVIAIGLLSTLIMNVNSSLWHVLSSWGVSNNILNSTLHRFSELLSNINIFTNQGFYNSNTGIWTNIFGSTLNFTGELLNMGHGIVGGLATALSLSGILTGPAMLISKKRKIRDNHLNLKPHYEKESIKEKVNKLKDWKSLFKQKNQDCEEAEICVEEIVEEKYEEENNLDNAIKSKSKEELIELKDSLISFENKTKYNYNHYNGEQLDYTFNIGDSDEYQNTVSVGSSRKLKK